jgi:hypothetical protein
MTGFVGGKRVGAGAGSLEFVEISAEAADRGDGGSARADGW